MASLKNNPAIVILLVIVAVIALGFSIYWTFGRGETAPPKSPFEGIKAPPPVSPNQAQPKEQAPMAF
jgi:flagellar basal body-associated protein FliL